MGMSRDDLGVYHPDREERMINGLCFVLTESLSPDIRSHIHEQIRAFNDLISRHHRAIRHVGPRPLDILIRDAEDKIVGGLIASTYWGWLDIDDLWVTEDFRGQGLGRRLLRMAEEEARARGCSRVRLAHVQLSGAPFL
jgi:GNAT superfamily N-acetyltransferase